MTKHWSIKLGRFAGIDVFIHWTFWIIIGWIFLLHFNAGNGIEAGIRGILFILALFLCVVLHEFGHALTARRYGITTRDITLYPIGGVASLESMPDKPAQELAVAVAGPLVNAGIAVIIAVYLGISGQFPGLRASALENGSLEIPFVFGLFVANTVLFVFNLIPAFPMDGGRILRALLSFRLDKVLATQIAAGIGQSLAILFVFLGFFFNFWLVFIGLFVYLGAAREAAFEKTKALLAGLRVKDALMHKFTVLNPDDTLGRAVDSLLDSQETHFLITEENEPVGVLSRNEIIKGLSERGRDAPVSLFMQRDFVIVGMDMKLQELLQKIAPGEQDLAVVIEGGSLVGLIDRQNVEERLLINEALKQRRGDPAPHR
ncbi:MAG: site-2 protease family protein [Acidobacteriota bacterium]|nr:site-2 protease family protein [Acidobacteriota bacterium]MDH3529273.1 site-2 protease family protein [Acidobacteriota bacterium]